MQKIIEIKPFDGIDTDTASREFLPTRARYKLNCESGLNERGASRGVDRPVPANRLFYSPPFTPAGTNTPIGSYYAKKTNETYIFVHNSLNSHYIYRINGADNSVQLVYMGAHLGFSLLTRHGLDNRIDLFFNPSSAQEIKNKVFRKYLTWTDGLNWQGFLDVETSIATNSFSTAYFATTDPKQFVQMAVRPPLHCITGDFISIDADDYEELAKTNSMKDSTWQFTYKYIYTDARETVWGPITTAYYIRRSACQSDASGLPRCMLLKIPAGGPNVEKIVLAFRNCNGNPFAEENPSDFFRFDIVDKYDKCLNEDVAFYSRSVRPDDDFIKYLPVDNAFTYVYCGDKECTPIDVTETNQSETALPITSYAQTSVENRMAYFNNTLRNQPVGCSIGHKIALALQEEAAANCEIEYAVVKVAVLVHNVFRQVNEPLYTFEQKTSENWPKQYQARFGGLMYRRTTTPFDDPTPYQQYFPEGAGGFQLYVEGTDILARTEQWFCDNPGSGIFRKLGLEDNFNSAAHRADISRALRDRKYYVQFGELKVPKGSRGYVRVASHLSKDTDAYKDTSTTVYGILDSLDDYNGRHSVTQANTDFYRKELFFDTAGGDVDLTDTPIIVMDLTFPSSDLTTNIAATAWFGYIKDKNQKPVERAQVVPWGFAQGGREHSYITDHNGFYFVSFGFADGTIRFYDVGADIYVEGAGCTKVQGEVLNFGEDSGNGATQVDGEINYADYENKYFTTIRVTIRDCNGVALPGISVAIAGSKAVQSSNSGVASLVVRNRMWAYGSAYNEVLAIMQNALCYLTLCGGNCNSVMPIYTVSLSACFSDGSGNPVEVIVPAVFSFNTSAGIARGLKPGGRYQWGYKLHDIAGRHTFIQTADHLARTLPTVQEKGFFNFSRIFGSFTGPLGLPSWVVGISLWRTSNLLYDDYLQWVVDKVEFIDAAGKITNNTAADKIRLSIQSIAEYNYLYAGATNVRYQYTRGDRVRFIANSEGKIYQSSATQGDLDFLIESDFKGEETIRVNGADTKEPFSKIVISYDARLKDLKEGALIELITPKSCETVQRYWGICDMIDVVNGEPVISNFELTSFDTYHVRRVISYNDKKNSFAFPFEHHSPSDFWGDHCDDRGRLNVKNEYEKQLPYGKSVFLSLPFLENGNFNGLASFRDSNSKFFEAETTGDITIARSRERMIVCICEFDNFRVLIADDIARTGRDGILRVTPGEQQLSQPESDLSDYGCQYDDITSAFFEDEFIFWVDSKCKAPVVHDYNRAYNIAYDARGIPRTATWWQRKLARRFLYNVGKTAQTRMNIYTGYDPVSEMIMVTFRANGISSNDYINNQPASDELLNETVCIDPRGREMHSWLSFTPQHYAVLYNTGKGKVFFTFRDGIPWIHREIGTSTYNSFYGVACDQYITIVPVGEKEKNKQWLSTEVQASMKFFKQEVVTSDRNALSRTPPVKSQFNNGKWNIPFLRNVNTKGNIQNKLYRGDVLRGHYAVVTLVRDNRVNDTVNIDNSKRLLYSELGSIFILYFDLESSAFTSQ